MSDIEESEISSSTTSPFNPEESKVIKKFLAEKEGWKKYGKIRVYCHETIFIGPVRSWWWCLFAFTILVYIIAQFEYYPAHYYLMIASSVVILVYLVATIKTILCNPGIWPRPTFEEAYANAIELVTERHRTSEAMYSPSKYIDHNGKTEKFTYCHRCNNFRPPRTGHCGTCDVCVEEWDHHCPVYGGCVGKKNYQYFFTMAIATGAIHMLLLISCMIIAANRDHIEGFFGFMKSSIVVSVYVVSIPMVCILPLILSFTPCERNKGGVNFLMDSAVDRDSTTNNEINPDNQGLKFRTMASNNTTLDPFLKHLFPSPKGKKEKLKPKKPKPMTSEIPLTIPQTPNQNQPNPKSNQSLLKKSQSIPNLNELVVEHVAVELDDIRRIDQIQDIKNANDEKNHIGRGKNNDNVHGTNKLNNITYYGDTLVV